MLPWNSSANRHTLVYNPGAGVVPSGHISNHRARLPAHLQIILLHVPFARGTFLEVIKKRGLFVLEDTSPDKLKQLIQT